MPSQSEEKIPHSDSQRLKELPFRWKADFRVLIHAGGGGGCLSAGVMRLIISYIIII